MTEPPRRVLFLCTHNSARSQMAEGMLRAWGGDRFEVASAGTHVTAVRPEAVATMAELGIDISHQRTTHVSAFVGRPWDLVITVCDDAREACPVFPGAVEVLHWSFEDPTLVEGDDPARMAAYRGVARQIAERVRRLVETPAAGL